MQRAHTWTQTARLTFLKWNSSILHIKWGQNWWHVPTLWHAQCLDFKWITAASQSSLWRTAKGAKLCEIPLHHSYGGSNVQSQKWQRKNAAEVVPLTCCKALRKLFSLAGQLQGAQQRSHFVPVFADNVAWYFKICINGNPLNNLKKIKWKMKIRHTLHYFHAMLNTNSVWYNCRIFHMEKKNNFEGEMSHVEICKDLKSNTSENE